MFERVYPFDPVIPHLWNYPQKTIRDSREIFIYNDAYCNTVYTSKKEKTTWMSDIVKNDLINHVLVILWNILIFWIYFWDIFNDMEKSSIKC